MSELYTESRYYSNKYRDDQFEQINNLIKSKRKEANLKRASYFKQNFTTIEDYKLSIEKLRADFINMLGWPLNTYFDDMPLPNAQIEFVAEDYLGKIYRLNISVIDEVTTYGMLFLPNTPPPYPLVICQHGGSGTPEVC